MLMQFLILVVLILVTWVTYTTIDSLSLVAGSNRNVFLAVIPFEYGK